MTFGFSAEVAHDESTLDSFRRVSQTRSPHQVSAHWSGGWESCAPAWFLPGPSSRRPRGFPAVVPGRCPRTLPPDCEDPPDSLPLGWRAQLRLPRHCQPRPWLCRLSQQLPRFQHFGQQIAHPRFTRHLDGRPRSPLQRRGSYRRPTPSRLGWRSRWRWASPSSRHL